jgi:hypothetical protein
MLSIGLEWQACPDGVEVVDYGKMPDWERQARDRNFTVLTTPAQGEYIRARSQRRIEVRVDEIDLETPLALRFFNASERDERLSFIGRFGMLDADPEKAVPHVDRYHRDFRRRTEAAFSSSPASKSKEINHLLTNTRCEPSFDFRDDQQKGRLLLTAKSLISYMCIEVAVAAANGAGFVRCENCDNAFFTGPLAHRRSDAKTCSTRCRVAAMRRKRASSPSV